MTAMIDTLKFAKSFELAGFAKPQAEALTAAMAELNSFTREDLATKTDLRELGGVLRREIQELGSELRGEIHGLGSELRGEIVASRSEAKADLKVAVAELKGEIVSINAATKTQILWTLLGSQFFVVATFVVLNNFNKFFN